MASRILTNCPTCNGSGSFYGITVAETDGSPSFSGIVKINFNSNDFYIEQNAPNTDEAIVNFRGTVAAGSGEANTASNLGGGAGIFAQKVGVDLQFKSLVAGANITLTPSATEIEIASSASGGGGGGFYGVIFRDGDTTLRDDTLRFNPSEFYLTEEGGKPQLNLIQQQQDLSGFALRSELPPGFYGITVKTDNERFNGLNIVALESEYFYLNQNAPNTDEVRVGFKPDFVSNLGGGSGVFAQKSGKDFQLKSLVAGANVTITPSATEITIAASAGSGQSDPGFYGIIFRDGDTTLRDDTLRFNPSEFYLTEEGGKPQLNLVPDLSSFARFSDLPPAFYGLTVGETDTNTGTYREINTLKFFANDFYINQNFPNTDEAIVNLRHRLTLVNDSGGKVNTLADVVPSADSTFNLGSPSNRNNRIFGNQVVAVSGATPIQADFAGGSVHGYVDLGPNTNPNSRAAIRALSLTANPSGAFASGYVSIPPTAYAHKAILTASYGSAAFGRATSAGPSGCNAYLRSTGLGSLAAGQANVSNSTNPGTATLEATGSGSLAVGSAFSTASAISVARITASNSGAWAGGYVRTAAAGGGYVQASGRGSFAFGYALNTSSNGTIFASGRGSLAFGYAANTVIGATANNSFQFGPGTNSSANSMQLGSTIRLLFGSGNIIAADTVRADAFYLNGGGETANTASNLGAGEGIFAQKVDADLRFKSLVAGTNITLTPTANDITISASGGSGQSDPGFYGIIFRDGDTTLRDDTLRFNPAHFYLSQEGGKPQLNLVKDSVTSVTGTFSSSNEWQLVHNLQQSTLLWDIFDDQGEAIIPDRVDVSNPTTAFFYFITPMAGSAIVASGITDGVRAGGLTVAETNSGPSYGGIATLKFFANDFYISQNVPNVDQAIVNLRHRLTKINDSGGILNTSASIIPEVDITHNLGSAARRHDKAFARHVVAVAGTPRNSDYRGGSVFGIATSTGLNPTQVAAIQTPSTTGLRGAFANGLAIQPAGGGGGQSFVRASGRASFASGGAYVSTLGARAYVQATASGSTAFGYAFTGVYASPAVIEATLLGAFVTGAVSNLGGSGTGRIRSSGRGSFAGGYVRDSGYITASGNGSMAFGYVTSGTTVAATAANSFQFGVGSNANVDTLQCGSTIFLKFSTGEIELDGPLNHDGTTAGFFAKTPVTQRPDCFYLAVPFTATTDASLAQIAGTGDDTNVNNNFAELAAKVNRIRDALRALGLMAGG